MLNNFWNNILIHSNRKVTHAHTHNLSCKKVSYKYTVDAYLCIHVSNKVTEEYAFRMNLSFLKNMSFLEMSQIRNIS